MVADIYGRFNLHLVKSIAIHLSCNLIFSSHDFYFLSHFLFAAFVTCNRPGSEGNIGATVEAPEE